MRTTFGLFTIRNGLLRKATTHVSPSGEFVIGLINKRSTGALSSALENPVRSRPGAIDAAAPPTSLSRSARAPFQLKYARQKGGAFRAPFPAIFAPRNCPPRAKSARAASGASGRRRMGETAGRKAGGAGFITPVANRNLRALSRSYRKGDGARSSRFLRGPRTPSSPGPLFPRVRGASYTSRSSPGFLPIISRSGKVRGIAGDCRSAAYLRNRVLDPRLTYRRRAAKKPAR